MISPIKGLPDDIQQALSQCLDDLDRVILEQSEEQQRSFAVPRLLYHYTDGQGLLGILESGKIRLTDIFGLNDPSEIRHGIDRACEILGEESKRGHPAAGVFSRQFRELMDEHIDEMARFFVACFSRSGDDLGQWRAYAANGSGFALGFDGAILERAFISAGPEENATIHVYYDDKALSRSMSRLVHAVIPVLALPTGRKVSDDVVREFITTLGTAFSIAAIHAALLFKHEAYRNEDEYRFLHVRRAGDQRDDLKRRARGSQIVRFSEFDWKERWPSALRDVVIGPAADRRAAGLFIEGSLKVSGLRTESVAISRSHIPYRV